MLVIEWLTLAERRDARLGGIGARDDRQTAAQGGAPQVDREAADVMAVADRDAGEPVPRRALEREVEGPRRESDPGQAPPVPGDRRAAIADHLRRAVRRHRARLEIAQIGRRDRLNT